MHHPRLLLVTLLLLGNGIACSDPADTLGDEDPADHDHDHDHDHDDPHDMPSHRGDPLPMVEVSAWSPSSSPDPLADHRPQQIDCPVAAWGPENESLEIETGACNYFYATQPSLAEVLPGDTIELVLYHEGLDAPEPAEAHVALLFDGEVVWEQTAQIPSEAEIFAEPWVAQRAWPVGTPVGLHLHNHGYNSWTMQSLAVVQGE